MTSGKNALEQFRENCMIEALNPDKFQTTIMDEKHSGLIYRFKYISPHYKIYPNH